MSDAATAAGGIVGLLLAIGALILGICWLIFPFVVAHSLGKIEKLLAKQNELLASTRDKQPEFPQSPPRPSPSRPKPHEVSGGFQ